MKLRYLLPLAGVFCTSTYAQPSPARQAFYEGACRISSRTMLCYETPLAPLAAYLREYINVETASDSMSADDAIVLSTDPTLGGEAFRLTVLPQRIEIAGGSYGGVFNGVQALFRLLPAEIYAKNCPLPVEIACTKVEDAPRFPYRGMMLDVARTWIDAAGVKRYIDLLSYHGINKLHLHLSDDEGWRIEIRSHPELTEIGGFRGGDSPVRPVYGKWDEKYGGYYTQDEMRGLIRYAAARNIEIIPEIDLPGHSLAAIGCYPQLACDGRGGWGKHFSTPLCIGRDSTIAFCKNVLTELFDLFPSQYVHIGGDEVERTPWETCPDCQRRIRAEKLEGAGELQAWFTRETEQFLAAHGKTLLGWDEITEDGLTPQSAVMWWRSWMPSTLTAALQNGHRVIESPSEFLYLNGELDRNTLGKVYGWEPLPESLRAWEEGLLGIQANMWTEDVPTADAAGERLFPRLLAVAETAWSAPEKRDFADFRRRLPLHLRQLERAGWNYRLDDVEGVCDDNVFIGAATVRLLPPESAELYYTLDGTVPDTASQRYTAPFSITDSCTLTLRCYNRRGVAAEIRRASFRPTRYAEPSADAGNLQNGLLVRWYDYDGDNCADIDEAPLQANFITDSVVIPDGVTGNIGLICDGYIDIPADGIYSFYTYSDDGSTLAIDGRTVVDNDGLHSRTERSGQAALRRGVHSFSLRYFDTNGGVLEAGIIDSEGRRIPFSSRMLKH